MYITHHVMFDELLKELKMVGVENSRTQGWEMVRKAKSI